MLQVGGGGPLFGTLEYLKRRVLAIKLATLLKRNFLIDLFFGISA